LGKQHGEHHLQQSQPIRDEKKYLTLTENQIIKAVWRKKKDQQRI
jgi:hypothetical protein